MNSSSLRCFRVFDSPAIIQAKCLSATATVIDTRNSFRHATHLFDELPQGSLSSLNSQLALLARRCNFVAVWDQFRRMHRASLPLDAYTFTPVLSACSALPGHQRGTQVHALMIKVGTSLGTISKTALMDMYSKYGCFDDSVTVFGEMESPDVVSWNALISSYLRNDLTKEALAAFVAMRDRGVEFSEFTLCSVVKACVLLKASLIGLVNEGLQISKHMKEKYSLQPGVEHYSCFIDVLGRAGCIEDAWSLYDDMIEHGIRPTSGIWASLLNVCNLNEDASRGEFAAQNLLALELNNPGINVLLSNFFASIGRWDAVGSLRSNMKDKGLSKESGSSRVNHHLFTG